MAHKPVISALSLDDFGQWFPLWHDTNLGQTKQDVTTETWMRLNDPQTPVHGMKAEINGEIIGIMHYILHPTTGQIEPVCYMQDLYIAEPHRRNGYARQLVEALVKKGREEKWARIYWTADRRNEGAQALYQNLGVEIDFSFHVYPLN